MQPVGPVDGRGRLAVVGAAAAGALMGGLVGWFGLGLFDVPLTPSRSAVPVVTALVVAAVFVWLLLRTWRGRGGYRRARELDGWLRRRRVPSDVPAGQWQPAVERIAARSGQAWGKSLIAAAWVGFTIPTLIGGDGNPATLPLTLLWIASLAYHLGWVVPRARAARRILTRGVPTD